jgi:tRNA modification GTPase
MILQQETICALATPQGVGAIAVLRVSGEKTFEIVNRIFKGRDLTEVESHTIHFGTIRDGETVVDEVLVSVFKTPKSFTREDVIEISCHGSDYIIRYILKLLVKNGCRMAKPGEFTQRAFLNGQFDLVQAEAVADLIAADSEAAHKIALNQLRGGFSKKLGLLREELIHFASLVELELDFGEEDVEFANRDDLKELILKIQHQILPLIDSFDSGNAIKEGIPVAIIGPPNAGKSTLLNTLLNEEKAIVTEIAGTTRDVIEDVMFIDGIKFRFIDTAGIRETKDLVESIGIERSKEAIKRAEIVLLLSDNEAFNTEFVDEECENKVVYVRNKVDLRDTVAAVTSPNPLLEGEGFKYVLPSPQKRGAGGEVSFINSLSNTKPPIAPVSTDLLKKARSLRKNATNSEDYLWQILRNRQVNNLKFRRQHPLEEGYILDFYSHDIRLGIELDGGYHNSEFQKNYDTVRTMDIELAYGIKIIRFKNEDVFERIEWVLEEILKSVRDYTSPNPLLEGEDFKSVLPSPPRREIGGEATVATVKISAKNNIGIEELKKLLVQRAKSKKQADTTLTNLRHYEHLIKASQALDDVLNGLEIGITGDFLAQDIRLSLHHLGEITGTITTDDLLANIFSRFCIGK